MLMRIPPSFWRFGLVGVGGLFVDMAVLYSAMGGLALSAVPAKVLSFLAAATFTWWMNRRYTFGRSGKSLLHEWASFLATNAFGGTVNFAVYTAMVTQLLPYAWMPALATAAGSVSGLLFNYTASRHIVFKQGIKPHKTAKADADADADAPPLPRVAYPLTLLVCLGFGGLALWLGMDANWDLRNYHWYNGWAFIHSLVDRNPLVSQIPSFYNPTLDAAYAWASERLPARAIGFALGMAHGLNFLLLFAIVWRLAALADPRWRFFAAAGTALAGVVGGVGLSELGTVFYDNLLGLCVSASVLVVVAQWHKLAGDAALTGAAWALAAGFPAGLAFGLKQPMVLFCLGLCAAFLLADMPWLRRIRCGFWFGIGVLLGFAVGGGHWAWHLWLSYSNPLFPFMNQFFHSPWALPADYRDDGFLHRTLAEKLVFVYRFSFDSRLAGEIEFRDFRIMALMTLMPLVAISQIGRQRPPRPFTRPGPTGWLLTASVAVYAIWVPMFSIYRYLVPLEMLAPALILSAIGLLPLPGKLRAGAAIGLLGFLVASTAPGDWQRVPWENQTVPVAAPAIDHPEQMLTLLSGYEPLSYLLPAFPKAMRFYRIDSNFKLSADPEGGFRRVFREAIRNHQGAFASLHSANERNQAVTALAAYGLTLDEASCRPVTSAIAADLRYFFCQARKLGAPF